MSEVVREGQVARERVREGVVEIENFEEAIALDDVQVAVGECANVRRRLTQHSLPPELVSEHVAFACNTHTDVAHSFRQKTASKN